MKLDLILENVRNRYSLGLLEEAEGMSEKDLLKGKIMINESTMQIRKMLVEEGVMQGVRDLLEEGWGQRLVGAGALAGVGAGGKMAYDAGKQFVDHTNSGIADNAASVANAHQGIVANAAGVANNTTGVANNAAGVANNATGVANNTTTMQDASIDKVADYTNKFKSGASELSDKLGHVGDTISGNLKQGVQGAENYLNSLTQQ